MLSEAKNSLLIITLLTFVFACSGGKMEKEKKVFTSIKEIPEVTWKKLAQKRIYFGHQSVGDNIVSGIQQIMNQNTQIKLNIVETNDPAAFNAPVFAHFRVGKNEDPKSKCDAFAETMDKGIGGKADMAFVKFCFVDVTAATDIDDLFNEYKKTVSRIKDKYPKTTFVHVTVPLTTVQTGIKAWIKQVIGRQVGGYENNASRGEFNDRLRSEYEGIAPIFDLANVESTFPDGSKSYFKKDGKIYASMVPQYTNDGGHLNEKGSRLAADELLTVLATVSQ